MAELKMIPLTKIKPREDNLRVDVDADDGFVQSIRQNGVLTPLTVVAENGHYLIDAGHRRFAGAKAAKLTEVPCYVTDDLGYENQHTVTMLVENMQRKDLNPIEQAEGMSRLVEAGWKQAEVASFTGLSKPVVSRRLALLALPDELRKGVAAGTIELDRAELLAKIARLDEQAAIDSEFQSIYGLQETLDRIESEVARIKVEDTIRNAGYAVVVPGDKGVIDGEPTTIEYLHDEDGTAVKVEPKPLDLEKASKADGFAGFKVNHDGSQVYICEWRNRTKKKDADGSEQVDHVKEQAKHDRLVKQLRLEHAQAIVAGRLAKTEVIEALINDVLGNQHGDDAKVAAKVLQLDPVERTVTRYLNDGTTKEGVDKDYVKAFRIAVTEAADSPAAKTRILAALLLVSFVNHGTTAPFGGEFVPEVSQP